MAKKVGNTYFFTGKGKSSGGGGGGGDAILYTEQTLTESEQMQARKNQGLYYSEGGGGDVTINWDGDTTGKDYFEGGHLYKVSTDTPQAEQLKSFVITNNSESLTFNIGDAGVSIITASADIYAVSLEQEGAMVMVCLVPEALLGGYTFTQGIWLYKVNATYVSQLVYEATETIHHIDPKYIKDMYYSEGEDEEKTVQTRFVPLPSDWRETLIILEGGSLGYARYSADMPNIDDWVQIVDMENIIPAEQLTFQQESGYYTISEGSGDYQIIVVQAEGITIPDVGSPTSIGIYVLSHLYGSEPVTAIESVLDSMTYNIKATVHQIPAKYIPQTIPAVKIEIPSMGDDVYYNMGILNVNQYVPSRDVVFSVEGHTVVYAYAFDVINGGGNGQEGDTLTFSSGGLYWVQLELDAGSTYPYVCAMVYVESAI